mmetsp:Transcript_24810/g.56162  ORF Transcript_24810/g.56162 Transcript_24810/m.56162 type:complete len:289 (-) Transcript_24810:616-1482(-)
MANQKPVSTSSYNESRRMRNSKPKDPDGRRGSLLERHRRENIVASYYEESLSTTNSNGLSTSLLEKQKRRCGSGATGNDEESLSTTNSTPKDPGGSRASPRRRHAADYTLGDRLLPSDVRQFRRANSGESLTPKGRVFVWRTDRTFTCAEFEGVNGQGMPRFRVNEAGSFKAIPPEKLSLHVLVPTTGCDSWMVATVSPPTLPVVTRSAADGINASVPEQEKIHKVGERVLYRGRDGLALATVQDVYLDDQLSPYYCIRLQDGSERQTDNEHICLVDLSFDMSKQLYF